MSGLLATMMMRTELCGWNFSLAEGYYNSAIRLTRDEYIFGNDDGQCIAISGEVVSLVAFTAKPGV